MVRRAYEVVVEPPAVHGLFERHVVAHRVDIFRDGLHEVCVTPPRDQHFWLRVPDHVGQLVGPRPEGERDVDGVELRGREVGLDVLGAVDLQHGDAVAGSDAHAGKSVCEPIDAELKLLVADAPVAVDHRDAVRHDGCRYRQELGGVHPVC